MPSKFKNSRFVKSFALAMAVAAALFICYLFYLWRQSGRDYFVTYREFGIPIPTNYSIHGIDVSRYQQRIAWDAVQKMQVASIRLGFAFIKATEGTGRTDPFFKRNWERSKKAGIVRGAYHFFLATRDGTLQAKNFTQAVTLESGDLPPVLDIEQTFGIAPDVIRSEVRKWCNYVEGYYGIKPIIYTNADFYKRYLQGHLDAYPLWVAHYLQPHQPRISRDWVFWQHSESGTVNGIFGKVDFNVFNGDSVAFRSLLVP
jgi:lysozyme